MSYRTSRRPRNTCKRFVFGMLAACMLTINCAVPVFADGSPEGSSSDAIATENVETVSIYPGMGKTEFLAPYANVKKTPVGYGMRLGSILMYVGDTAIPDIDLSQANLTPDVSLSWSIDNTDIASIDPTTGEIRAIRPGRTIFQVTDGTNTALGILIVSYTTPDDNQTGAGEVPIATKNGLYPAGTIAPNYAPELRLEQASVQLEVGETNVLKVFTRDPNAEVKWESDAPWIASVDGNGALTGISAGTATITCTVGDVSESVAVTVTSSQKFTVSWVVGEDVHQSIVKEGDTPVYDLPEPFKAPDEKFTYRFAGWSPGLSPATQDQTYVAQFVREDRLYAITFIVDGVSTVVHARYNERPIFPGSVAKAPDGEQTYTFIGWDSPVVNATADATYIAQYEVKGKQYQVTWSVNGRESLEYYQKGEVPEYKGTPTKPDKDGVRYTFAGWNTGVVPVTGNTSYTALFVAEGSQSMVTWNVNGQIFNEVYNNGDTPAFKGWTEDVYADGVTYRFSGWDKEMLPVSGPVTYVAQYKDVHEPPPIPTFTVSFVDWDGTGLAQTVIQQGGVPTYPNEPPARPAEGDKQYVFTGWSPELSEVYADTQYVAQYQVVGRTEYLLTAGEIESLAKEGSIHKYEFQDGTLYITPVAIPFLQEQNSDIGITVMERDGVVSVSFQKNGSPITEKINGLVFYANNIRGYDSVALSPGSEASYKPEVYSAVKASGAYVRIPGTCSLKGENSARSFSDVNINTRNYSDIQTVVAKDIMIGVSDIEFSPNTYVTRAEMIQTIYRMLSQPSSKGGTAYNDVKPTAWYARAIFWASANKILPVSGRDFYPESACSNEDIITAFNNTASYLGISSPDGARLRAILSDNSVSNEGMGTLPGYAARSQMAAVINIFIEHILASQIGETI